MIGIRSPDLMLDMQTETGITSYMMWPPRMFSRLSAAPLNGIRLISHSIASKATAAWNPVMSLKPPQPTVTSPGCSFM